MRTTRALIAGFGTTGSLVAAAACVALIASAVIAFKGWPGTGLADRVDNLFVNDQPPVSWDSPGTSAVAAGAAPAAAAVAATPTGPAFGPAPAGAGGGGTGQGGGGTQPGGGGGGTGGGAGSTSTGGGGGGGPGGSNPIQPPDTSEVGGTVQRTIDGAGQTVRDTTSAIGNSVGGGAGNAVSGAGQTVGDTVDSTRQSAGQLLGGH